MNGNLLDSWLETDFDLTESLDSESGDFMESEGESYDDSDGSEASWRRRRGIPRRRYPYLPASRRMVSRPSGIPARRPIPRPGIPPSASGLQMAQSGIAKIDLENQLQSEALRRAFAHLQKQNRGTAYGVAATNVLTELNKLFPGIGENQNIRALSSLIPSVIAGSGMGWTSWNRLLAHPTFLSAVLLLAATLFAKNQGQRNTIKIFPAEPAALNASVPSVTLSAIVTDANGIPLSEPPTIAWKSTNPATADVSSSGVVTRATIPILGTVFITASAKDSKTAVVPVVVSN